MKNKQSEQALINKSKKDIKDFGEIYKLYNQKIFRYFLVRVNSKPTAEDLTSITFEKALKNIKSFQWQGVSISAWLYQIARNSLIDYYRKEGKKKEIQITDENNIKDESSSIETQAIEKDGATIIQNIIDQLPKRERNIVRLKFYEGMTNKQIAKTLDITETNVSTILHRTMKKLHELLATM